MAACANNYITVNDYYMIVICQQNDHNLFLHSFLFNFRFSSRSSKIYEAENSTGTKRKIGGSFLAKYTRVPK